MTEPPVLPPLYARWIEQALGGPLPRERRAACDPCVMSEPRPGPVSRYNPGVKCCSYWPGLPAFLVGHALADAGEDGAAGRAILRGLIDEGRCATPLGIDPPPAVAERYAKVRDERFGVDPELLCPYFERGSGRCHIWPHRGYVCATYFCLHERRMIGQRLWNALKDLLSALEKTLSTWCLLELTPEAAAVLLDDDGAPRSLGERELPGWVEPDGRLAPDLARQVWGRWQGKEEAYYLSCAERTAGLDWAGIAALGGVRLEALRRRAAAALRRHEDRGVPDVLCVGLFDVVESATPDEVMLHNEEIPADPLPVPAALVDALAAFDGRPTAEAVERVRQEHGVALERPLLEQLVDGGLLGPPDGVDLAPNARPDGALEPGAPLRFFRGFRRAKLALETGTEEGKPALTLTCGHKEIVFDEPELFDFARGLYKHRHGFRAGDAPAWAGLGWERVHELLGTLLEAGLLQRLPAG